MTCVILHDDNITKLNIFLKDYKMIRSALLAALIAMTLTACGEKPAEEMIATPEEMTETTETVTEEMPVAAEEATQAVEEATEQVTETVQEADTEAAPAE